MLSSFLLTPTVAVYVVKHVLAWGLFRNPEIVKVPVRFSMETVGKRKAPAGASLTKRSKCLVVD